MSERIRLVASANGWYELWASREDDGCVRFDADSGNPRRDVSLILSAKAARRLREFLAATEEPAEGGERR